MKSYFPMLLVGAAAMLNSCTSNDYLKTEDLPNEVRLICQYDVPSRATDTNFEQKDRIGVYMVGKDATLQIAGNELNNELFTYDGKTWTSVRKVFWNTGSHNLYAYYPYSAYINDTEDYTFDVAEDQSTHAGYTSSDFLWSSREDITASASPVVMKFSHRMSKVIVKLEKSEDYEGELPADCEVYIHNTIGAASISLSTGGVSKDLYSGIKTIKALKISNNEYHAIVVPQNIETRRPLVEIITQGVSYLMEGKISFKQGYSHTLVVTLSKNPSQTKIDIGGGIGGWD